MKLAPLLLTLALSPICAFGQGTPPPPPAEELPLPPKGRREVTEIPKSKTVPEDLLDDDHVQEEAGISDITTPSIKKIFEDLETLGSLPYETLKRPVPEKTPTDRTLVALNLGILIGDGFLAVQTEKISDFEEVGRAILKFSKVLGAGAKVKERVKSILESSDSALGNLDWKELKGQLSQTQREVKHEMVLLRDIDMVHLVALGGWIRGLHIATVVSIEPFSADKARVLGRADVAEYFINTIGEMPESTQKQPAIAGIQEALGSIITLVNQPEGKPFSKEEVQQLKDLSDKLMTLCTKY